MIDSPSSKVERQVKSIKHLKLLDLVVPDFERGTSSEELESKWKSNDMESKYQATDIAKEIAQNRRRAQLTDFDRYVVCQLQARVRRSKNSSPPLIFFKVLYKQ